MLAGRPIVPTLDPMLIEPSRVSMQMSLSSCRPTSDTAKDSWSGSSSYRLWLPTSTPSLEADIPSQQCPAVMTLLEPTMDPPHMRLPPPLARGVERAFLEKVRAEATARQAAMTIAALMVNTLKYCSGETGAPL